MRIAFATPEFITDETNYDGGLANYLGKITKSLVKLGHDVSVFVSSEQKKQRTEYFGTKVHYCFPTYLDRFWVPLVNRKADRTEQFLIGSRYIKREISKEHRRNPFDVIQYSSYGLTCYHRLIDTPCVIRISSIETLLEKAKHTDYLSESELKLASLEEETLLKADKLFCPSSFLANKLKEKLRLDVTIIHSPFEESSELEDLAIYNKYLLGKKYILFWGSIGKVKGSEVIAKSIPLFLQDHKNISFVMVGKDHGGLAEIRSASDKLGVADRVIHIDKLRHPQLFPIIKASWCCLLPSKVDNYPNTVIEALALGKVVVGTKGSSIEELIQDEENGYLFQVDDSSGLIGKLEYLINASDNVLRRVESKALASVKKLNSLKIASEHISFYEQVINDTKFKYK